MIADKFWKNHPSLMKIARKVSPLLTKDKMRPMIEQTGRILLFLLAIHFLFGIALSEADDSPHPTVLSITKTDSADPVKPGDTLTYTINYSNSSDDSDESEGSKTVTNVVITETYDSNVTFVSASPPPDVGNNQWNIGTLKCGHSGTITVTVTVMNPLADGTQLVNNVSIQSDQCSKTAQEITTVQSNPVLGIKKIHSVDPVAAGANLTYTITYSNATSGTEIATNTVITETYDPNVTFVSASPSPNTGNNQWDVGDLAPGDSGTITVTVAVKTPLPNGTQLVNKASIQSGQDTANTQEVTTVQSSPVLAINKIHSVDPVAAGANLTYTITYSNSTSASETATNAVIKETYDPNVTFVSASPPPNAGNNQWNLGSLAPGDSGTITVTVQVKADLQNGTQILNSALIQSDQGTANTQEVTTVQSHVVLAINKIGSVDPVAAGANLIYTITYSNATSATETATNVVIKETYDPNVTFVSASPPPTGNNDQWTIGSLAPGASGTITVTVAVKIPLQNGTQILNSALIQSDQGTANTQEVTTVQSDAVLAIKKTHSVDPVKAGENLTYTITYANSSGASETATNVVIKETYDPNVTFVSASPVPNVGNTQWNIGTLSPGQSGIITLTVKVKTPLPNGTQLINNVLIESDQGTAHAREVTTVQSNQILTISKTGSPNPVVAGEILTYIVNYGNNAGASESATNVVVKENYNPNVTFVSATPPPNVSNNQWNIGTLAPGASGSIEIKVRVAKTLAGGTLLSNEAIVTSDQGSSLAEDAIAVQQAAPVETLSVPTMNEWGMIIFSFLAVCTGLWILRRRGES